jgi:hypothetical protein
MDESIRLVRRMMRARIRASSSSLGSAMRTKVTAPPSSEKTPSSLRNGCG